MLPQVMTSLKSSRRRAHWSQSMQERTTLLRLIWDGPARPAAIRVAELESIQVYPLHRNRGVGEQLMAAFLSWAAGKGAQSFGHCVCG
jgi:GNAT superfamily N-acetyltransferase